MKLLSVCTAAFLVTVAVVLVYNNGNIANMLPALLLYGFGFIVCWVVYFVEIRPKGKKRKTINEEQRKSILNAIGMYYEPHCCDNCAHYLGCSGGHRLGPPCSDCHEGLDKYETDHQAKEADEALFYELEKILNYDK